MEKTGKTSIKITDRAGRTRTLLQGKFAFVSVDFHNFNTLYFNSAKKEASPCKKNILFLGLGADPQDFLPYCRGKNKIFYLEHNDFAKQVSFAVPASFQKITEEELLKRCTKEFLQDTDILFYKQNLQLFPAYWNNILIALRSAFFLQSSPVQPVSPQQEKYIFLSGGKNDLLHAELMQAIKESGFLPVELGCKSLQEILELLDGKKPALYLSVNAEALDANGIICEYLNQKHIPLALWFVDNPWNILSNFSQDWWKDSCIFLTDFSFAAELEQEGAKHIFSLPLASHTLDTQYFSVPEIPLFFVGNSSFANKNAYFSGCRLEHDFEQNLYRVIQFNLLQKKALPDFHVLRQTLFPNEALWQNKNQRLVSYAAAKADLYLRKLWLETLSPIVHIMGDNAWQDIISTPHTYYKPVNYYTHLPSYYKNSLFTLNLTSLLMPANLSQRHFDVWSHGGFLISSPSEGMNIFPQDLVPHITVQNPSDCLDRLELLLTNPKLKTNIQTAMQSEITQNHTYKHRLQHILELV